MAKTRKVCSRGHKYRGSGPCPVCWPGSKKRNIKNKSYKMRAVVWVYPGMAGWHFITLPQKQSQEIKARFAQMKHGWGSLPVAATVGKTTWKTSIFPDKKSGAYLLPLKADVRKSEKIKNGDIITFLLEIRV